MTLEKSLQCKAAAEALTMTRKEGDGLEFGSRKGDCCCGDNLTAETN